MNLLKLSWQQGPSHTTNSMLHSSVATESKTHALPLVGIIERIQRPQLLIRTWHVPILHLTPAASEGLQLLFTLWEQLTMCVSNPRQVTSSMTILPFPWPKWALPYATGAIIFNKNYEVVVMLAIVLSYQMWSIPIVCKQLPHPENPTCHHTQCPGDHWHTLPRSLQAHWNHLPATVHRQ